MMGTCVIVLRFFTICGKHVSNSWPEYSHSSDLFFFIKKQSTLFIWMLMCLCVMSKGDSEDAAADCGRQHVQELLHHRRHVPSAPLLRLRWCCALRDCQIWREHQPVGIRFFFYNNNSYHAAYKPSKRRSKRHLHKVIWLSASSLSQARQLLHSWQGYHRALPYCHRGRLE